MENIKSEQRESGDRIIILTKQNYANTASNGKNPTF
jgi:hypothetical protein